MTNRTISQEFAQKLLSSIGDVRSKVSLQRIMLSEASVMFPETFDAFVVTLEDGELRANQCLSFDIARNDEETIDWVRNAVPAGHPAVCLFVSKFRSNSRLWTSVVWVPEKLEYKNLYEFNTHRLNLLKYIEDIIPSNLNLLQFRVSDKSQIMHQFWLESCQSEEKRGLQLTPNEKERIRTSWEAFYEEELSALHALPAPLLSLKSIPKLEEFRESDAPMCLATLIEESSGVFYSDFVMFTGPKTLTALFHPKEPRYYLIRYHGITALVSWFPETCNKRQRLMYAGVLPSFAYLLSVNGIKVNRKMDIRYSKDSVEPLFTSASLTKGRFSAYSALRPRSSPPQTQGPCYLLEEIEKSLQLDFENDCFLTGWS